MLTLIVIGVIMMAATLWVASRRLDGCMPLVQSCSFAIAAACHPPSGEVDAFRHAVQWGSIPGQNDDSDDVGHCCFSAEAVVEPQPGKLYA